MMRIGHEWLWSVLSLLGLVACAADPAGPSSTVRAVADDCGAREVVEVSDVAGLLANIGRDHVDLRLAPGRYVLADCPAHANEWSASDCGQLRQGNCSVLGSGLQLAADAHGVPLGSGTIFPGCASIPTGGAGDGAVIDCGALAASDLELSCLVAGNRSTIQNLTVCQGSPPAPLPAGTSGVHRNGIMILADHEATVEWVRVVNARRGAIMTALDGHTTRGAIRHSLVEGTELAGMFVWARQPTGQGTNDAHLFAELASDRIVRAGLHPFITAWSFGSNRNEVNVSYIDDVVEAATPEAPNVKGIALLGEGEGHRNQVRFEVRGGSLAGGWGVVVQAFGNNSSNNDVQGVVSGVTIENAVPALGVVFPGQGNAIRMTYDDNRYLGDAPGVVRVVLDKGSDLEVAGSAQDFADSNQNIDATALSPYFSE